MSLNDNNDNDSIDDNEEEEDEDFNIPENINFKNNPKPASSLLYDGKEIKSWRQLNREDKVRIKVAYLEGTIRGFKIYQMRQYILAVSKINIDKRFLYEIRRQHELDNRHWFYTLARDRFAYVGVYRKCIDEIELYKEGLWRLVVSPTTADMTKVAAYKELHNMSKTSVLLLKDLPFIMSLSKQYDPSLLDPNYEGISRLTMNPRSPSQRTNDVNMSLLRSETDKESKHHTNLVFNTIERIESRLSQDEEFTKQINELHNNSNSVYNNLTTEEDIDNEPVIQLPKDEERQ